LGNLTTLFFNQANYGAGIAQTWGMGGEEFGRESTGSHSCRGSRRWTPGFGMGVAFVSSATLGLPPVGRVGLEHSRRNEYQRK